MRPRRYPYSGKKKPIAVTIDPKYFITNRMDASLIANSPLILKNKVSEITISGTKIEIKAQSITGV